MKKRIYGILIACLFVTQQAEPFFDPASLLGFASGIALDFVQQKVLNYAIVALVRKANEFSEQVQAANQAIEVLDKKISILPEGNSERFSLLVLKKQQEAIRNSKETSMQKVAGIALPMFNKVSSIATTYNMVVPLASRFGFSLPTTTGLLYGGASWLFGVGASATP